MFSIVESLLPRTCRCKFQTDKRKLLGLLAGSATSQKIMPQDFKSLSTRIRHFMSVFSCLTSPRVMASDNLRIILGKGSYEQIFQVLVPLSSN